MRMDDAYFFDGYEQDKINELENTFIEKMKILMKVSIRRNSIKYRKWRIGVYVNRFIFRGRLSNNVTVYIIDSPTGKYLYVDKFCFTYYQNNMLLRAVCYAFEITTAKEFERFIGVLTTAAVSII